MLEEPTTLAALIALSMGLVKIVEKLVDHVVDKVKAKRPRGVTMVQLDTETAHILRDMGQRTNEIHSTLHVRDNDGVPLVYSSRSEAADVSDSLREVVDTQKDISHIQERMLDRLDGIDEKLERNLRLGVIRGERQ